MVTIQSDSYSIFIRKIGYSVGLENSLRRVRDLVDLYSREKDITPAAWKQLVHSPEPQGWGLDTDHIADFFKELDLIQRTKSDITILPGLDAMALAQLELGRNASFDLALRLAFASSIILADGDIFLNFLAGEFERDRVEPLLRDMILTKRKAIKKVIKVPQIIARIFKRVAIDVQPTNVGGAAVGKSLSEKKRTEPLRFRTTPLNHVVEDDQVHISDDYFRKVSGRRRDWAKSIDLCDEKGRQTELGHSLIAAFKELGIGTDAGAFSYWPFSFELERLALSPQTLGVPSLGMWDHLIAVRKGLKLDKAGFADRNSFDPSSVEELIRGLYRNYRILNSRRVMLRKEMPLNVLYTALVAIYSARGKALLEMRTFLRALVDKPNSQFLYRSSRHYEGTLYIKD